MRNEIEKKSKLNFADVLKAQQKSPDEISCMTISEVITVLPEILDGVYMGLKDEDLAFLKKMVKKSKSIDKKTEAYKDAISMAISEIDSSKQLQWTEFMLKMNESLRGIVVAISFISKPALQHVSNLHKSLNKNQLDDYKMLMDKIKELNNLILEYINPAKPYHGKLILKEHNMILNEIDKVRVKQIERIRKKETPSRSSLLFLNIVSEFRIISYLLVDIYQFERKRLSELEDSDLKEEE